PHRPYTTTLARSRPARPWAPPTQHDSSGVAFEDLQVIGPSQGSLGSSLRASHGPRWSLDLPGLRVDARLHLVHAYLTCAPAGAPSSPARPPRNAGLPSGAM